MIIKNNISIYYFIIYNLCKLCYIKYCNYITFDRLDRLFPKVQQWENDFKIYSVSMPIYFTKVLKKRCILLISGYRDIPYIWSEIIPYFQKDNIDYYAPRTHGNGRSFFQDVEPDDWVITYLEAIYILQEMYEEIDIIAFSTGCVIALYISQFNFKCKINNIILCAPFLLKNEGILDYYLFNSYLSYIIAPTLNYIIPLRIKTPEIGFKYVRDTHYDKIAQTDFYELCGFIKLEIKLMKFKNLRPTCINANNITILYPNDDKIIGDIYKQHNIIYNIFKKDIDIISIPSDSNIKCGHVMFKENPDTIKNIYSHFYKILFNK
jgi:esterase/lipase